MRLPFKWTCKAIMMEDKEASDLLVHGFVRKDMNECNINIPFALISLMTVWYGLMQYIHVLHIKGNHWKINVDKITGNIL